MTRYDIILKEEREKIDSYKEHDAKVANLE